MPALIEIPEIISSLWRARRLPIENGRDICSDESVFIGGCGRSGTTLLRVMLGVHPDFYGGPELNIHQNNLYILRKYPFLPRTAFLLFRNKEIHLLSEKFGVPKDKIVEIRSASKNLADFVSRFLSYSAKTVGKKDWIEKTPYNVTELDFLFRNFSKAKFIHIIRDGRDVVCSLRNHPKYVIVNGEKHPSGIVNPARKCISRWIHDVSAGILHRENPRYLEVTYENLVLKNRETLLEILNFLERSHAPEVFNHHLYAGSDSPFIAVSDNAVTPVSSGSIGRWMTDMKREEAEELEREGGELLRGLGYTSDRNWVNDIKE